MDSLESRVKSVFSSKAAKGLFASLALAAAANAADLGISPAYRQYTLRDNPMPDHILRAAPKSNYERNISFSFTGNTNNIATILKDDIGNQFIAPPPVITETNGSVTVSYCIPSVLKIAKSVGLQSVPPEGYATLPEPFSISVSNDGIVTGSLQLNSMGMIAHIDFSGAYMPSNSPARARFNDFITNIDLKRESEADLDNHEERKGYTHYERMIEGVNANMTAERVIVYGASIYAVFLNTPPRLGGSKILWTFDDTESGAERYLTLNYRTHINNDVRGGQVEIRVNGQLLNPND